MCAWRHLAVETWIRSKSCRNCRVHLWSLEHRKHDTNFEMVGMAWHGTAPGALASRCRWRGKERHERVCRLTQSPNGLPSPRVGVLEDNPSALVPAAADAKLPGSWVDGILMSRVGNVQCSKIRWNFGVKLCLVGLVLKARRILHADAKLQSKLVNELVCWR